jgi:hypothetical protein
MEGIPAGDFVVKLAGAMDTRDRGPACEVVAVHLAEHFRLCHPEPASITIHPDLSVWLTKQRPDLKRMVELSTGRNFGTRLLTDVTIWPAGQEIPAPMLGLASAIFAFDALISNDDRRMNNPNVLAKGNDLFVTEICTLRKVLKQNH